MGAARAPPAAVAALWSLLAPAPSVLFRSTETGGRPRINLCYGSHLGFSRHPAAAPARRRLHGILAAFPRLISTKRPDDEYVSGEGSEVQEDWEEEEETEPQIGDGGDGGGIFLRGVDWGEKLLSVANDILGEHFGDDMAMFAFKVTARGYVYVRLDKLTHKYGSPSIEEMERFSDLYKQQLDQLVDRGEVPLDLALEVSSPGAERLLKVPDDLERFKDMPMRVQYVETSDDGEHERDGREKNQKDGIFLLEGINREAGQCVWKLANVRENREEGGKGRPLSRKQKDWRLQIGFEAVQRVLLYVDTR